MNSLSVLILAAGKGVRMKSAMPKVLHPVGGRPMICVVLDTVASLKPRHTAIVVGHQGPRVKNVVNSISPNTVFFEQAVLDGSGGAVRRAAHWLRKQTGDVLVTCGDMPLLQKESLRLLLQTHRRQKNAATVLTAKIDRPSGYGRIVRRRDGSVEKIIEELDASPREKLINEINTGTYCFNARALASVLPKLTNRNAKKEYYLTDTLQLLQRAAGRVGASYCVEPNEGLGVNSRRDLAVVEASLRQRKINQLMDAGVTVLDPSTTYVETSVQIGPDTIIFPQTYLRGTTRIGSGCRIGPWAHISDTTIENDVIFQASFAEGARIRSSATVGPYARIRPGSDIGSRAHIGNFCEIKKTRVGAGSKANHLSYLGDATLGKNVNIGAGTITCNYDGIQKFPTIIQDHAFIGSNSNLVAPVRLGAYSVVGAGSTITRDVPGWSLAVERSATVIKKDWARKKFKKR